MRRYRHSEQRVPTGRPYLLREVYDKTPSIDDRICALPDPADPTEYEAIADALWDLFLSTRNLAEQRSGTGCTRHPDGPVDTEAPEDWGFCLLCNTHRRRGQPSSTAAQKPPKHVWAVPPPPYTHGALLQTRRALNDALLELNYRAPDASFQAVADLVHAAFVISRELSRPRTYGCLVHPGAPLDPAAPKGRPMCIFCAGRERRASYGPPTVTVRPSRPLPPVRHPDR